MVYEAPVIVDLGKAENVVRGGKHEQTDADCITALVPAGETE